MVPMDVMQDAVVTLVALGAVAVLFRRVVGVARPSATPGCASCPSAQGACQAPAPGPTPGPTPPSPAGHPLVFIRQPRT